MASMPGRLVAAGISRGTHNPHACFFIVMPPPTPCGTAVPSGRSPGTSPVNRMLNMTAFSSSSSSEEDSVRSCAVSEGGAGDTEIRSIRGKGRNSAAQECKDGGGMPDESERGVAVITVDTVSGQLLHVGVPQKDLFATMREAMDAIPALCSHTSHPYEVLTVCEFVAFAGACLTEEAIHLLFVTAVTPLVTSPHSTPDHSAAGMPCDPLAPSTLPPICVVRRAQWHSIPLRVAVPALQQPLTSTGVHVWLLSGPRHALPTLTSDTVPPYLFFSPGLDVTHCSVLEDAVRRCAAAGAGGEPSTLPLYSDTFLPPLPVRTGRNALGRCDCLWNEELIGCCDVFGLGNWCCRLALGSCSLTALTDPPLAPNIALLVVRFSRLAFPGCLYNYSLESASPELDEYVSTLETEFQLFIVHARRCTHGDGKTEVVSSLTWRRGADFAGHAELFEQKKRFKDFTARFVDPLPPREDHVAAIFSGYMERYGPGTKISLVHAGSMALRRPIIVQVAGDTERCASPSRHHACDPSSRQQQQLQQHLSEEGSPQRRPHLLMNVGECFTVKGSKASLTAVGSTLIDTSLQNVLQSLAEHIKAHGLLPPVTIGALCTLSTRGRAAAAGGGGGGGRAAAEDYSDGFLQTFWGGDALHGRKGKLPEICVPRVCISDDTETGIIASIIVCFGWVVMWVCDELYNCSGLVQFLQDYASVVDSIFRLLASSAAGTPRINAVCVTPEAVSCARCCLAGVCVEGTLPAFSPLVWDAAQRIAQLTLSTEEFPAAAAVRSYGDDTSGRCPNTILNPSMRSFLMNLFLGGGGFYPRELVRHRTVLISHPSRLSMIISAHLMVPQRATQDSTEVLDEAESPLKVSRRRFFPFTPMRPLNLPNSCEDNLVLKSSPTAVSAPTLSMFQGLVHPSSQPLLVPSCYSTVDFTIALPSLSYITHVALEVANAVQEAPYAAVLSLSLVTCCYMGQTHERVVLEDMQLPLCGSSRTRGSGPAAPRLVFFELQRPGHSKVPFSVLEASRAGTGRCAREFHHDTPVIARFLRFILRGSGCNPMAMPPVLVFGEPLQCIPHDEQPAVVGYRTTLRRMLGVTVPPFLSGQGDEGCTGQPQLDSPPHGDPHNEESGIKHKYSDSNKIGQDVAGGKLVDKQESHINAVAEAHGRQEMYLHKVSNSIPAEFFQLDLALALELESKRLQCHTCRYYRDWCLHRIGVPRWIMNPAYQVLPHSAFHRSHLPEETADILFIKQQRQLLQSSSGGHGIGEKKRAKANREKRRRCALCRHGFSWLSGAKECGRCQRHVCEKCISENPVRLIELGIRNACAYVCLNCSKKVERLEDILMRFRWSEHEGGVDTDTETEEAIDFYARSTIPRIASVLPLYPNHSSSYLQARPLEACGMPYQLTLHPLARVVSAPGMDSDTSVAASISPLFEEVLGVEGLSTSTLVSWRCVVDEEWTESATRISRHVVILLPHPAAISHGELHYTLAEAPRGAIEVQLQVGDSLQSLRLFHSTSIAPYTATGEMPDTSGSGPQVLKLLMQQQQQQQQQEESASPRGARGTSIFTALFFVGAVMDLALLRVEHFSVWGCFTPDRPGRCAAYYKCKPDMCRYGGLHTPIPHCTSGVLGVACLPRMLPMTRPIPLRNMILHTDTELVLFEFDFAAPSTVCGFALELHHPAAMTTSHCGIATALRLIGVSASGYRGNLGLFHLPWPPLPSLEMNLQEIFAYAYSLPLPVSGIVSVLVEVVEWRLVHAAVAVGSPSGALKEVVEQRHSSNDDEDDTNNGGRSSNNNNNSSSRLREAESPPRRGIYLGKLHFWTSADASTRRMVSSHTYTSVHAALDGADPN